MLQISKAQGSYLREGFTSHHDDMPRRFFNPHISGPLEGIALDPATLQKAKETYYDMMGWPQGSPSPGKLAELGIEWVIPFMKTR